MAKLKRPILAREDRNQLHTLAAKVATHTGGESSQRAYATGVYDLLDWLTGADPTPLLEEVTR